MKIICLAAHILYTQNVVQINCYCCCCQLVSPTVSLVSTPNPIHTISALKTFHLSAWEAQHHMRRLIYTMASSPMLPEHVVVLGQITVTLVLVPVVATSQISPCQCTSTRIKCSAHACCAHTMQRITRN